MERIVFNRHLHTANHDKPEKSVTIQDIRQRYNKSDAIIIEDHGKFLPQNYQSPGNGPLVLPGCEWATPIHPSAYPDNRQHVGLLGVDAYEQSQLKIQGYDSPFLMQEKVHSAGGALVYNHPEYPYIDKTNDSAKALDYIIPLDEAKGFDAIELFNDVGFTGSNPAEVLKWVEKNFYKRNLFPSMVGGQDDHGPSPVAKEPTYTIAMAKEKSEPAIMDAVRSGRTYVSKSLDTKLDLSFDGINIWERNQLLITGKHSFKATLANLPDKAIVEVVRQDEVISRLSTNGGEVTVDLQLSKGHSEKPDYIYIRVWSEPGKLHTVSSAIPIK